MNDLWIVAWLAGWLVTLFMLAWKVDRKHDAEDVMALLLMWPAFWLVFVGLKAAKAGRRFRKERP